MTDRPDRVWHLVVLWVVLICTTWAIVVLTVRIAVSHTPKTRIIIPMGVDQDWRAVNETCMFRYKGELIVKVTIVDGVRHETGQCEVSK